MKPLQRIDGLPPDRTAHRELPANFGNIAGITEIGLQECGIDAEIGSDNGPRQVTLHGEFSPQGAIR